MFSTTFMHIVSKRINGTNYYRLEQSVRIGDKVEKRIIANLGRASKIETLKKDGKPRKGEATAFKRLNDKKLRLSPEQIHRFTCDIWDKEPPNSDCWQTPDTERYPIVSLVREMFGGQIGLDPTTIASNPTEARHFFTMRDNCLWQSWKGLGHVFMNPPFSSPATFLEKLVKSYQAGDIKSAIVLLPSRCRQDKGSGALLKQSNATCVWNERIQYVNAATGELVRRVDFPSSLDYYGMDVDRFNQIFSPYGEVK